MRLIGMLDSPYVRRVAITARLMGLGYTHEPLSVFRNYDDFATINPVVKAPTLVTDDGAVLMDSELILEWLGRLAPRLVPAVPADHARALRITGLALAACEKAVQIVYEHQLRPTEKRHQPWLDRVSTQLRAAWGLLDGMAGTGESWLFGETPLEADVTLAVAWRFTQEMAGGHVPAADHPAMARFSARAEALPQFRDAPFG